MAPEPTTKIIDHNNGITNTNISTTINSNTPTTTTTAAAISRVNGHARFSPPTSKPHLPPEGEEDDDVVALTTGLRQRNDSGDSTASSDSYENYIPTPPDGGYGWVVVMASLVCNLIVDGIGYSFGVFLVEFADYFRESKGKVSLVGSLLCGIYLFAGPVVSALTNKFGCRAVTVVGSVIASISFLIATQAPSVDVLIVTYGVMGGFGLGMMYLPSIVSVGYYFEKKRALATGIAVCGSGIGTFIFAPLSEFLLESMDWKNALMIISGITLNGAVFGMLMRPLEPARKKKVKPQQARAKNLLDRLKEQRRANRGRTISEMSNGAYSVRDTNAVLERVMEAKLLRERRLQDDDSELGSLPSIFVRGQSRKDSASGLARLHKLSISERGEPPESPSSLGSVPKILVGPGTSHDAGSGSLINSALARLAEAKRSPEEDILHSQSTLWDLPEEDRLPADTPQGSASPDTSPEERKLLESSPEEDKTSKSSPEDDARRKAPQSPSASSVGASDVFADAQSRVMTEDGGSCFFTPPSSPLHTTCPTTPEKEAGGGGEASGVAAASTAAGSAAAVAAVSTRRASESKALYNKRKSDPEVSKFSTKPSKDYNNGSVPSNIHHQVHEVAPLLQVPGSHSKRTLVHLGQSSKSIWHLKHLQSASKLPAHLSLHSLSVSKKDLARPLYRKDIFYSGSVLNIPQFQSQPDMKSYITSITTIPGEIALLHGGRESKVWKYLCFPPSCKDTLQQMMDFSLLRDPGFMLICLGNVLAFLGFYVPFVYCMDMAFSMGIDKKKAAFLISIIGIANTIGRVAAGWLADLRMMDSLVISFISILLCGVCTAIFPFCTSYALLCVNCCCFGLSVAGFISLSSILICDLCGLQKLTNGFGLMTLFRGMAAMAGPPLAGFIYGQTGTYDASFFTGGGLLVLGAGCHLALKLPCVARAMTRRQDEELQVFSIEDITVDPPSSPEYQGSAGVRPELITMDEVLTSV